MNGVEPSKSWSQIKSLTVGPHPDKLRCFNPSKQGRCRNTTQPTAYTMMLKQVFTFPVWSCPAVHLTPFTTAAVSLDSWPLINAGASGFFRLRSTELYKVHLFKDLHLRLMETCFHPFFDIYVVRLHGPCCGFLGITTTASLMPIAKFLC